MKKIVSIILAICLMFSMVAVATTSASAFLAEYALTKACDKLVELGVRTACAVTLELSEHLNEDEQEAVESICSILLMDATEKAIAQVQELCEEILDELYEIEKKLTDYTNNIGSSVQDEKVSEAKDKYMAKWSSSFYDVLESQNGYMDNAYVCYVKYLVASNLNQQGGYPTEQSAIDKLQNFAEEYKFTISASDVTDEGVAKAKSDLVTAFCQMNSSTNLSEADTYSNTKVNGAFVDTINALVDELKGNKEDPNLLSYAATFAYYALPYEHQQYEFVYGVAQSHVMKIMLLEMAYNEYLSCQGEYLYNQNAQDNADWADEALLHDGIGKCSYNSMKTAMSGSENTTGILANVAEACGEYVDSKIYINTTSETGSPVDIETHLGEYIKPEDVAPVNLNINGYESEHNYHSELSSKGQVDDLIHIDGNSDVTKSNQIKSNTLKFNRVVPGNESGEVYYILDPTQFASPLHLKNLVHRIKRVGPAGGSDSLYGDIYIASCDYLNLTKNMTDGTNTYVCPEDLQNDVKNLFNTSALKAYYKYDILSYLNNFGYVNADDQYLISSDYSMDYSGGSSLVKSGDLYMQNLYTHADTSLNFDISEYDFEEFLYNNDSNYTLILKNTSGEYLQSASVKVKDDTKTVQDVKIVYNGNEIGLDSSGNIKSGEKITIKFKLLDDDTFASLKCIRNNATQTETVLIDGTEELQCFDKDSDGYYVFEYYMPYSNVTFEVHTEKSTLKKDENGNYMVRNYADLCAMSDSINNGDLEYINGNYVVENDITVPDGLEFTPAEQFWGTFDGQGYTISGLSVEAEYYANLFKENHGTIKNLVVANSSFSGKDYIGLVGVNKGTISDVAVVDSTINGRDYVGVCGRNFGTMENVTSDCTVNGRKYVGGVAAYNGGTVSDCCNTGEVKATKDADDVDGSYGGGVVGCNDDQGTVKTSYNTGNVYSDWYAGGIVGAAINKSTVENCYNTGTISADYNAGGIIGHNYTNCTITSCYNTGEVTANNSAGGIAGYNYYGVVKKCYNIDTVQAVGDNYGDPTEIYAKTAEQFKSGEVAYLLNNEVTDGTQVWYQNIDNGLTADDSPVLLSNNQNTVYKVNLSDKTYSNKEQEEIDPSLLTHEDLRTYQRIIEENGSLSDTSKIAMGYGKVDNYNNVITVYMADTADRMGVLMHQGVDGKKGVLKLQGDYPKYSETSGELLRNPDFEEPEIYTDGNGCIFIAQPKDGEEIPELTVEYTAKPVEDNKPVIYTLKVEIIDISLFEQGKFAGGKILHTLSETDPDYNVIMSEYTDDDNKTPTQPEGDNNTDGEIKPTDVPKPSDDKQSTTDEASKNTGTSNGTVQTGTVSCAVVLLITMLALTVGVFSYRRKEDTK